MVDTVVINPILIEVVEQPPIEIRTIDAPPPAGTSGTSGTSGTDGASGTSGSSGTNGSPGGSGTSGSSGTSGTSGQSGTSGTSGGAGTSGSSGSSGTTPSLAGYVPYTGATADVNLGAHAIIAKSAVIGSAFTPVYELEIGASAAAGAVGASIANSDTTGIESLVFSESPGSGNADFYIQRYNSAYATVGNRNVVQIVNAQNAALELGTDNTIRLSISGAGAYTLSGLAGSGTQVVTVSSTGVLGRATYVSSQWVTVNSTDIYYASGGSRMYISSNSISGGGIDLYAVDSSNTAYSRNFEFIASFVKFDTTNGVGFGVNANGGVTIRGLGPSNSLIDIQKYGTGTQVFSIDNIGNVYIKTLGISTAGLVYATTAAGQLGVLSDGSANQYLKTDGSGGISWATLQWTGSGSDIYRSSGNVGVGVTPTTKLDVAVSVSGATDVMRLRDSNASRGDWKFAFNNNSALYLYPETTDGGSAIVVIQNKAGSNYFLFRTDTGVFSASHYGAGVGVFDSSGNLSSVAGASGTFTTADLKTVTVSGGVITSIV